MNFLNSMSTLQLGLIAVGALLLVALAAWNVFNSRRNAPKQAEPVDPGMSSPAALRGDSDEASRLDPVFDSAQPDLEPLPADAVSGVPPPHPPPPQAEQRRMQLDPLIDVVAPIAFETAVTGEAVLHAMPPTRRVGSKPFAVEGLHAESNEWQAPRAGERYSTLQAGVQMANRSGALNEIEYSEFVMKTQGFADALGGAPEFPEMLHEVARAKELDQFASDHDAQLGFKLHARGAAWSPGYLQQHAARLGFVPGPMPGRLVLPTEDPGLPPLLTLSFDTQAALAEDPTQAAVREVGLSLDVPQVPRSARPYPRMREVAAALAQAMDGVVTDERGQPLNAASMDQIEIEVEKLYDRLDTQELSAGSALARRLFS